MMNKEELDKLKKKLNPKQQLFAELYSTTEEFYGNGLQAYIKAYQPDQSKKGWQGVARACASRLLTNANVLDYINAILETGPLSAENLDKQLALIVTQNVDFMSKRAAIRDANQLKGRIKEKIELSGEVTQKNLPPDEDYAEFLKWKASRDAE